MNRHLPDTRGGLVAIVGRPNVGKSTLMNRLIGQKLSITAHKPQTTRHRILGIHTDGDCQVVYVDTPGIHVGGSRQLNQVLNRTAAGALQDVTLILLLVQAPHWNEDDQRAFDLVKGAGIDFLLVVNKIDRIRRKQDMLPYLQTLPAHERLAEVLLISARSGSGVDALHAAIRSRMPASEWHYSADQLTDRSMRFLASEAVREQLTRQLSAELPYALSVDVETWEETAALISIGAVVWVEKASQKGIVVGKGGERLKSVGMRARQSLEVLYGKQVFLKLWVRVKSGWADDERALRSLGYEG